MKSDEFLLYFTEINTQYHRNNRFLILLYIVFIIFFLNIAYTIKENNRLYKEKLLLESIDEKRRLNEILRSKS